MMACYPTVRALIGTAKTAASLGSTAVATAYHGDDSGALSDLRNACDWLAQALAEASVARDSLRQGGSLESRPDFEAECSLRHAAVAEIAANGNASLLVARARQALRSREACDGPIDPDANPTYREDRRAAYAYEAGRFEALRETLELLRLPVPTVDDL